MYRRRVARPAGHRDFFPSHNACAAADAGLDGGKMRIARFDAAPVTYGDDIAIAALTACLDDDASRRGAHRRGDARVKIDAFVESASPAFPRSVAGGKTGFDGRANEFDAALIDEFRIADDAAMRIRRRRVRDMHGAKGKRGVLGRGARRLMKRGEIIGGLYATN